MGLPRSLFTFLGWPLVIVGACAGGGLGYAYLALPDKPPVEILIWPVVAIILGAAAIVTGRRDAKRASGPAY